jgi:hypothetical protein
MRIFLIVLKISLDLKGLRIFIKRRESPRPFNQVIKTSTKVLQLEIVFIEKKLKFHLLKLITLVTKEDSKTNQFLEIEKTIKDP